jgi:hypothetical protein
VEDQQAESLEKPGLTGSETDSMLDTVRDYRKSGR